MPLAGAVKFDQDDSLPGAEKELAVLEGQRDGCSYERGEDVIGHVRWIVRMAVAELGDHGFEGVEHVEIGSGIEVGCGQGGCGVEDE